MAVSEKDFQERLDKAIKNNDGRSYMFTLKVKKDQVLSQDQISSACNKWQENSEITHVYMGDCGLTDEAIDPLVEALKNKKGKPIQSLSVPNNQISEDGFEKLADFIKNNNSLSMVVLDGNKISHASRKSLEAAIAKRANEGFPVKIIHGESLGSIHAKSNSEESMFDKMSIPTQKALDKNKPLFSDNLEYEVIAKKVRDFDLKWDSLRGEFSQKLIEKKAFTEADFSKFKQATESLEEINKELKALSLPTIQQVSSDILTNYNSALEQSGWWGKEKKIQDAGFAIEDAFKDVAYSRIQVSNFVSDRISRQQNSLSQTIKKSEAEEKRQPTLTVKPSPIKVSKNNQPSEGVTAKSLMNLAEKSLEMPLLGLPLACAFFVASKICDAINFIGSKINSPEKIMPTAKGSEEAYPLASPLAFGSHIMNQQSGNSKTYETSGYAL